MPKPTAEDGRSSGDRRGIVYLLKCGPYYKIGKTTDPDSRYERLGIQLPHKPEVLHEIQTDDVDYAERHWHKRFEGKRLNGEWFDLDEKDISELTHCRSLFVGGDSQR